jgi:hypothetical protein
MLSEEKAMIWRSECEHGHPEWLFGLCPAGHRAGIQVRYFSLPEIKALLTEYPGAVHDAAVRAMVREADEVDEDHITGWPGDLVGAALGAAVVALADAIPSEEKTDASS